MSDESELTANQRARAAAKVAPSTFSPGPSDAERSAKRRLHKAAVTFECEPEQKQQLIEEAAELGISVSALVRRRVFGKQ